MKQFVTESLQPKLNVGVKIPEHTIRGVVPIRMSRVNFSLKMKFNYMKFKS